MENVNVKGIQMSFLRFGSGEKVFVLLPGLSMEKLTAKARAQERKWSRIAETYTVYLFDRRDDPPESYDIHAMAEDTVTVMRQLGLDRVCLCGISQGGMIAMDMAVNHPELVSALVLCSTMSYVNRNLAETLTLWGAAARERDSRRLNRMFAEKLLSEQFMKRFGESLVSVMPTYSEESFVRFLRLLESFESFDLRERLCEIACPAYVIGAGEDRVMGQDAAKELAGQLGCEYYVYPNYGHGVYDEAPDFAERVREFLQKTE